MQILNSPLYWTEFKIFNDKQFESKILNKHKLQEQKFKHFIWKIINFLLSNCALQILHYRKYFNSCLVPFNEALSRRRFITITQRASPALIITPGDEIHVNLELQT